MVIPVYNGQDTLALCLDRLFASTLQNFDVIVVDDRSTDQSVRIARSFPCTVLETEVNSGAAAARNLGAAAALTPLIYFLDADILLQPDTLARSVDALEGEAGVSAIFSSFQKETVHQNFVSVYKNLLQHYTHQNAQEQSASFCGGFSLIRRDVFLEAGGFDPAYRTLEDVEFGYRLHRAGRQVRLHKELQVTHCKYFTLGGLIRSDVFDRAVPWTRLMLAKRVFSNDLNTQMHHVLSVPLAFLMLASMLTRWVWLTAALTVVFLALNRGFLSFVRRERGWWFAGRASAMCWFGYLYSGAGAFIGAVEHILERRAPRRTEADEQAAGFTD